VLCSFYPRQQKVIGWEDRLMWVVPAEKCIYMLRYRYSGGKNLCSAEKPHVLLKSCNKGEVHNKDG